MSCAKRPAGSCSGCLPVNAGHRSAASLQLTGALPTPDPDLGYFDRWFDILKAGGSRIHADDQHAPPVTATREYAAYQRHLADLRGPPGFSDAVNRLDALIEAAPPADWDGVESGRRR